ncbi:heme-binding protein [Thalassorhabdus alkalitolerans]|uniref:Heme-binding protein n=1 Tax=Thalassorhabdus alkalitolerans TaxID=2282697 RepID=A0ABW0YI31_9BACI|nr:MULTISPECIES: heme-binding protein [Bacillaceae]
MKQALKLTLEEAHIMIEAAKQKAEEINVLETIAIVDEGGYLIALDRMNNSRITGPEIAMAKGFTAAGHKRSTHLFNKEPNGPVLPGNEAFGIQHMIPGKFAVFVGGFPIVVNGEVVGGVGVSGGNGEQDTAVGTAALKALEEHVKDQDLSVVTDADIKL